MDSSLSERSEHRDSQRHDLDALYSLAYEELRRLASCILRGEYAASVTPTTLVNEAWIKLAATPQAANTTPLHFRRIAGRAMRQILVDAARRRHAKIHGGELLRVTLDTSVFAMAGGVPTDRGILALHAALEDLNRHSPRQAQLVEARFFGGFSCEECAELFSVSEATVMRDWRVARAWLACEINSSLGVPSTPVAEA